MDSQLLTLTSMITSDFFSIRSKEIVKEKAVVIVLGALGFLIAVRPPQTILDFISRTTFNGLAVLAPTVLGGLYWKRGTRYGATASILIGEAMVIGFYLKLLHVRGILPVVPIIAAAGGIYILVSLLTRSDEEGRQLVSSIRKKALYWIPVFSVLFILGNDFWNWGRSPRLLLGLPLWVWYFFALGFLLSSAFKLYLRAETRILQGN
jgi:Na+/proline symporter